MEVEISDKSIDAINEQQAGQETKKSVLLLPKIDETCHELETNSEGKQEKEQVEKEKQLDEEQIENDEHLEKEEQFRGQKEWKPEKKKRKKHLTRRINGNIDDWWKRAKEQFEQSNRRIPITCGPFEAIMDLDKFGSGSKGRCIILEDRLPMTPADLEMTAGMSMAKKYMTSIRFLGRPLAILDNAKWIQRHNLRCQCRVCTNGRGNKETSFYVSIERGALIGPKLKKPARKASNSESSDFDDEDDFVPRKMTSIEQKRLAFAKLGIQVSENDLISEDENEQECEIPTKCPSKITRIVRRRAKRNFLSLGNVKFSVKLWNELVGVKNSEIASESNETISEKEIDANFEEHDVEDGRNEMNQTEIPQKSDQIDPEMNGELLHDMSHDSGLDYHGKFAQFSRESQLQLDGDTEIPMVAEEKPISDIKHSELKWPISRNIKGATGKTRKCPPSLAVSTEIERICPQKEIVDDGDDAILQANVMCSELKCLGISQCLDCCFSNSSFKGWCRFIDFRLVRRTGRNHLETAGFVMASGSKRTFGLVDLTHWMPKNDVIKCHRNESLITRKACAIEKNEQNLHLKKCPSKGQFSADTSLENASYSSTTNEAASNDCTNENSLFSDFQDDLASHKIAKDAAYVLQSVAKVFRKLVNEDRQLVAMLACNDSPWLLTMPAWRRSENVRELCDVCLTTLYNLHLFCTECGFAVCGKCVRHRNLLKERTGEPNDSVMFDRYSWQYCTKMIKSTENNDLICSETNKFIRQSHHPSKLRLVQLIPDLYPNLLGTVQEIERRMDNLIEKYRIALNCVCAYDQNEFRCFCLKPMPADDSKLMNLCHGNLLILKDPDWQGNLGVFQAHWHQSKPVIISNIHHRLDREMWSPERFKTTIRVKGSGWARSVIDCRTGRFEGWTPRLLGVTLEQFWDGYSDVNKRVVNKDGDVMFLKLKDFPATASFKEALPEHYHCLYQALPLREYTLPESDGINGRFNLVTVLPARYVKPDLGPKMYNAYGMLNGPKNKATTNLHLDISDACNLLVNVTIAEGLDDEQNREALENCLREEEFAATSDDYQRVMSNWREAGALWTIFHPDDNATIRAFISELEHDPEIQRHLSPEMSVGLDQMDDPIHDQHFYLTSAMRRSLATQGVFGCTFVQMLGDCVFIPACAAHQVRNLFGCVKVAEDFVTPEGTEFSGLITEELRMLTRRHQNHEDKLQLNNIVHFAVCESIAVLENHALD